MNEQQEKVKFREAIDHTLTGLEGDPFLYQRVLAQTEKGEKPVKMKWMKTAVIALIVALFMGTVALAGGMLGGTVNWLGEIVRENQEESGITLYEPTAEQEEISAKLSEAVDMLQTDGEVLEVEARLHGKLAGSTRTSLRRTVGDMKVFAALMAGAEHIPVPGFIPAGYELYMGYVQYTCRAGGEWRLIETLELDGGMTAARYSVEEEDMLVSGYHLFFRQKGEQEDFSYLLIDVELKSLEDAGEQSVRFHETQTPTVAAVPGMDNALLLTSENDHWLLMRRQVNEAVRFVELHGDEGRYGEVRVEVLADSLDVETMIRMFADGR